MGKMFGAGAGAGVAQNWTGSATLVVVALFVLLLDFS
jgi:hypothetical protein